MMADYSKHSESELLSLLQGGNQQAFGVLYNRYKAPLYLHAFRMLQDDEEARDIVQELFSVIWAKRESLKISTTFEGYLFSTIKNRILNFIAHRKVVDRYTKYLSTFVEEGISGEDERFVNRELLAIIQEEVAMLPPKMREVFEMSRYEGMSNKEIAARLGISDLTVKKQLNNAAKILKPKIGLCVALFLSQL